VLQRPCERGGLTLRSGNGSGKIAAGQRLLQQKQASAEGTGIGACWMPSDWGFHLNMEGGGGTGENKGDGASNKKKDIPG